MDPASERGASNTEQSEGRERERKRYVRGGYGFGIDCLSNEAEGIKQPSTARAHTSLLQLKWGRDRSGRSEI